MLSKTRMSSFFLAIPVLATHWRGIPGQVDHEVTGLLVEPKDLEALTNGAKRLASDPLLRQRLGAKGRERYLADFTTEAHLQKMGVIFSEALTNS